MPYRLESVRYVKLSRSARDVCGECLVYRCSASYQYTVADIHSWLACSPGELHRWIARPDA